MSLPSLSGTARLLADPELRFAASGTAVCKVRLAFNSRRLNKETNQWENADVFYVDGTVFNKEAEHVAESLVKGDEVVVSGRLKTDRWEDKQSGEKKSKPALMLDSIGPSMKWGPAKVQRAERGGQPSQQNGGGYGQQAQNNAAVDDPWTQSSGASDSEPPF